MTDPVNPAQTGTQGVATQQVQTSAQTTSAPAGAAQENAQEQPQYVTVEQLSQVTEQIVSRLKQSDKDRTARINSEMAQIKARLDATGVQLAPEQELKIREKIGNEIDEPADATPAPAGQASPAAGADQFIAQFVGDIFTEAGTTVTKNDPEWKELQDVIDATYNDPKGHIKVTKAALSAAEKKSQRMNSNSESAAARVVGTGGNTNSNSDGPEVTGHDLFQRAHRK